MGDIPSSLLNLRCSVARDMPTFSLIISRVQCTSGCLWISCKIFTILGSRNAAKKPVRWFSSRMYWWSSWINSTSVSLSIIVFFLLPLRLISLSICWTVIHILSSFLIFERWNRFNIVNGMQIKTSITETNVYKIMECFAFLCLITCFFHPVQYSHWSQFYLDLTPSCLDILCFLGLLWSPVC